MSSHHHHERSKGLELREVQRFGVWCLVLRFRVWGFMCKRSRRACEFSCSQSVPGASLSGQTKFPMTFVTAFAKVEAFMCGRFPGRHLKRAAFLLVPHGGARPLHQKSIFLAQLTFGSYAVQIWPRTPPILGGTKPAHSTVWRGNPQIGQRACGPASRGRRLYRRGVYQDDT